MAAEHPETYNPLVYFLVASAQGLNPCKQDLDVVTLGFFLTGTAKRNLKTRQISFLKYQLEDITPEHDNGAPPTNPVVTTLLTDGYASGQANGRVPVLFALSVRGGRGAQFRRARSFQYTSRSLNQPNSRLISPSLPLFLASCRLMRVRAFNQQLFHLFRHFPQVSWWQDLRWFYPQLVRLWPSSHSKC